MIALCHCRDFVLSPYNRNPLKICADLIFVIIYDAWHFTVQMFTVLHLTNQHISRRSCSHDHSYNRLGLPDYFPVMIRDSYKAIGKTRHNNAE